MRYMLNSILAWSEIWAPLMPLICIGLYRYKQPYLQPIAIYVILSLVLNIAANMIAKQKMLGFNLLWHNNIFIYNLHSVVRAFLFGWFFLELKQKFQNGIRLLLIILFLLFVLINFLFFEPFGGNLISSRLHATESGLLLFFCIQ